jgi:hypothetical protein
LEVAVQPAIAPALKIAKVFGASCERSISPDRSSTNGNRQSNFCVKQLPPDAPFSAARNTVYAVPFGG